MQSVLYVSPSTIPSRTANSIHVINQVNALAEIGHPVTLICASYAAGSLKDHISEFYGLKLCDRVTVDAFQIRWARAVNLQIALYAVFRTLFQYRESKTISRNLYFSLFSCIFRDHEIFETHGLEKGVRAWIQHIIVRRQFYIVVISNALKRLLMEKFNAHECAFLVLPDAASPIKPTSVDEHILNPDKPKVGYFGHIYSGAVLRSLSI